MRHALSIIALAAVLLVPTSRPDRVRDLAALAPAAGSDGAAGSTALLLGGLGPTGAETGPVDAFLLGVDDMLRDPDLREEALRRYGLGVAGLAGLALGLVIARRRRRDPAPAQRVDTPAEPPAPVATPEPPARPPNNSLSQALAAIDLMEIEVRTSLHHLERTMAALVDGVARSPLGSREPAARAAEAVAALAFLADATTAAAVAHDALRGRRAQTRDDAAATMERIHDVVAPAEQMDAAFQHLLGSVEDITAIPRLFDELEIRAELGWSETGGQAGPAIARARQVAMLRIEGLRRTLDGLTKGIVSVEERLVALDEAGAKLIAGTAEDDAIGGAFDVGRGHLERLSGLLAGLPALLAPADDNAARLKSQADQASAMIGGALGRLETILGNFVRSEERRRFHRARCRMSARILLDGAWLDCNVVNLSLGGAAIDRQIDCRPGAEGQLSVIGWDTLMPLVVTGTTPGCTHLCFQINDTLARSLIGYLETLQAA